MKKAGHVKTSILRMQRCLVFGLCLTIFSGITHQVSAQTKLLHGRVTDGKSPLELVNITAYILPDTTHVAAFTSTDSLGIFHLRVPRSSVLLKLQLVGFRATLKRIDPLDADSSFLGDIMLNSLDNSLEQVVITGRKKMIVKTPTGLIVNAEESITQTAGTVTDLLAAVPSVLVDAEGAITLRGKVPMILINGRNSALTGSGLDKIPASSVERVEIINTPSASNDAEAEAGIINIVLKKNLSAGTTGAVSFSGGAGARARLGSSLLFNKATKGWDFGLGYDNRFAGRTRTIQANRETYASTDERYLHQNRSDDRLEKSHNLRLTAERNFNEKSTLSFEGLFDYQYERNDETLNSSLYGSDGSFTSGNSRFSHEIPVEKTAELAVTYVRKYKERDRMLTAAITHSYENADEQTHISTTPLDENGHEFGEPYLQQTHNKEKNNITNARFDYSWPLRGHGVFSIGYKGTFRWMNSDFKSGEDQNGQLVPNPKASSLFDYREQIQAGYLQYKSAVEPAKGKQAWELGGRFEFTDNNGSSSTSENFSNSYLNFFPAGSITTYFSRSQWLRLSYAFRINRPGLGALNPFVDITDSLNTHSGNPHLKPELVHNVDLGYNHEWEKLSASLSAYYRNGSNTILPFTTIDSNGVALVRPENFGNSSTAGLEFIANSTFSRLWTSNLSVSVYHQTITGEKDAVSINSSQWSWYAKFIANFFLWKGSKWQWLVNYQGPSALPQGKRIAQYNIDMGLTQKCLGGKGRIGLTIIDIFNTRKSGSELSSVDFNSVRYSKADTRAILLTFGYTFGSVFKEKVISNQFNIE